MITLLKDQRPIRSQWRSKDSEKHVESVVKMVRALVWTVRGEGSSPSQSYILFTSLL